MITRPFIYGLVAILVISNGYLSYAQEMISYWELPQYKEKLENGKILTESKLVDLPGDKKRLDVVAFAYLDYNKDTLRKIKDEYKNMNKLSKNINESRILYKKGDYSIIYLDVCFLLCTTHYNVVVGLSSHLDKKVDKISWQFLNHAEITPYLGKEIASVPEKLDFPGMKGETIIQEIMPSQSVVAIQGSLVTQHSGFIRFFQKVFLKGALRNTAHDMRENLKNLDSFK